MVSLFPALIRDGGALFSGWSGKVGLSRANQGYGGTSHMPIRSGGTCRQSRWIVWGLISVQIQINPSQFRIHSCISLNTAVLFLDGIFVFFFSRSSLWDLENREHLKYFRDVNYCVFANRNKDHQVQAKNKIANLINVTTYSLVLFPW